MKLVSTDHKQVNHLTSLIICCRCFFKETDIFFFFVAAMTNRISDLLLFRKFNFFILLIPGTLHISQCLANVQLFIFDRVMYTYALKNKNLTNFHRMRTIQVFDWFLHKRNICQKWVMSAVSSFQNLQNSWKQLKLNSCSFCVTLLKLSEIGAALMQLFFYLSHLQISVMEYMSSEDYATEY